MMRKTLIITALMVSMLVAAALAYAAHESAVVSFEITPNPMDRQCDILIGLASPMQISLRIETLEGEVVKDIYNGYANKEVRFSWDRQSNAGNNVPSGNYMVVLNLDGRYTSTKKTLILK